jgi:hypothetical protein
MAEQTNQAEPPELDTAEPPETCKPPVPLAEFLSRSEGVEVWLSSLSLMLGQDSLDDSLADDHRKLGEEQWELHEHFDPFLDKFQEAVFQWGDAVIAADNAAADIIRITLFSYPERNSSGAITSAISVPLIAATAHDAVLVARQQLYSRLSEWVEAAPIGPSRPARDRKTDTDSWDIAFEFLRHCEVANDSALELLARLRRERVLLQTYYGVLKPGKELLPPKTLSIGTPFPISKKRPANPQKHDFLVEELNHDPNLKRQALEQRCKEKFGRGFTNRDFTLAKETIEARYNAATH